MINVDVSASTGAFGGSVCLIAEWIKEAIHIRKEQDKSMNRDEGSYQLSHIYDILFVLKLSGERRRPVAKGGSGGSRDPLAIQGIVNTVFCYTVGLTFQSPIIDIVSTRCQIFRLKCTKFHFGWGFAPDHTVGAYSTPQTPS